MYDQAAYMTLYKLFPIYGKLSNYIYSSMITWPDNNISILLTKIILHDCRFKFPSVLLVYYLSVPIIDDVVFFVRSIGSDSLFCHSPDLFETIAQPTPFCIMTGGYVMVYMQWNPLFWTPLGQLKCPD